jgi:hypothetical protein
MALRSHMTRCSTPASGAATRQQRIVLPNAGFM